MRAGEPILLSTVAYRMNPMQLQVLWLLPGSDPCHACKRIYVRVNGFAASRVDIPPVQPFHWINPH